MIKQNNTMREKTPYLSQWQKLLLPIRHDRVDTFDPNRSPFLQDYDRILFSHSFRMLARKTQVHPFINNDHVHHRQIHSLEVSSVGRSLGIMVGYFLKNRGELPDNLNPEHIGQIVQAACLAHDIGNPPFGHGGEEALQDWFKDNPVYIEPLLPEQRADFQAFDGNAQSFRVITAIENYKDDGGLRLSYPTLASLVKYPHSAFSVIHQKPPKFNYYQADYTTFDTIFTQLGLKENNLYRRHPLSYLTEAADDICYRIIDMEDALELGIITLDDILNAVEPVLSQLDLSETRLKQMDSDRRRAGAIRARLISVAIDAVFNAFVRNYDDIMTSSKIKSLLDYCDEPIRHYHENASQLFYDIILKKHSQVALKIGFYTLYKRILDAFIPACYRRHYTGGETSKDKQAFFLMGDNAPNSNDNLYMAYIRVIDYITSMTDPKATFLSQQLAGIVLQEENYGKL